MKNKIEQILLKAIGEDEVLPEDAPQDEDYANEAYNQALAELRAKASEIAEEILDSVVEEIEKQPNELKGADGRWFYLENFINHLTK
jgi:vacuolar-type H+-ATPase subunit H